METLQDHKKAKHNTYRTIITCFFFALKKCDEIMDGEKGHEQWENWEVALGTLDFIFERLVDFLIFS